MLKALSSSEEPKDLNETLVTRVKKINFLIEIPRRKASIRPDCRKWLEFNLRDSDSLSSGRFEIIWFTVRVVNLKIRKKQLLVLSVSYCVFSENISDSLRL